MKRIIVEQTPFDDYADWAIYKRNIFKRIFELLKDIRRQPFDGIGKPEPLKNNLSSYCSRRITDEHRLVYRVTSDSDILVISVKGHYTDL